jgi:ELWxxDGT repeat protein
VYSTNTAFYKFDGTNVTLVSTTRYPESGGDLTVFKGALYFSNDGGSINDQIWKYDGTNFTSLGWVYPGYFGEMEEFNGALYFPGEDYANGRELWKCDGTNITRVTQINPGSANANPLSLTVFKNALYFAATEGTATGLWKYDGTNASRVGNILLGSYYSLKEYKGALYLSGSTNGVDVEPWKYDGTNFSLVAQINPYHTNSTPIFWAVCWDKLFFSADEGTGYYQLWSWDGTNAARITDLVGSAIYAFSFFDTLYFLGNDGFTGYELWKYDGATVSLVADINPGAISSLAMPMSAFNNAYYFTADDGLHGTELWRLDPLSALVRVTSVSRQGNNVSLAWTSPGGMTNVAQAGNGDPSSGLTNNFTDCSLFMVAPTGELVNMNYLDIGGATNEPSRFYRIRIAQ